MLRLSLAAAALLIAQPGFSTPARDKSWAVLAGRLYPAIVATEAAGQVPVPQALADRRDRMAACDHKAECLVKAAIWSDAEIDAAASVAARRLTPAQRHMAAPESDIRSQIGRELRGLNAILQVYGAGRPARYPIIDGPIEAADTKAFDARVADAAMLAEAGFVDPVSSFDPSVALSLALLDANNRGEAARYEPLDQKYNAGAAAFARKANWSRYRYSAMIVLGVGPEDQGTPLSPRSKLNVRVAAQRFQEGQVGLIIVSGSNVHPRGTPFAEAVEMRKALIERFGVPADRIVLEPYARHTTTNLRNATRRMVSLGVPLDRDTIIVTNPEHSQYVESPEFDKRNAKELGYLPGSVGKRLSPNEVTFRPSRASLTVDPLDPLDP